MKNEKSVQLSTKIQELHNLRQKNKRRGRWAAKLEYKKKNVQINAYIYIVDSKTDIYKSPVGRGFALVHACVHVDKKLGHTKKSFHNTLWRSSPQRITKNY